MRKKLVGAATIAIMATTFAGKASAATYEVKPGDSLWKISNQFKISIAKLKEINNLKADIIYPRQVLKVDISGNPGTVSKSTVSASKTPSSNNSQSASNTNGTYTVKPGDYLIKIAKMHSMSVAELKSLNGLTSDLIRVGQVLKVSGTANGSSQAAPASASGSNGSSGGGNPATYKVVAGDTLSKIAARFGTTVSRIKQLNGLQSDLIFVGQTLKLNGSTATGSSPSQAAPVSASPAKTNGSSVLDIAKKFVGTKYAWGGASPSGFDCSGFIYYVFNQAGHSISRTSAEGYYNRSYFTNKPQPGDLVFFKNTYKKGISHLGIYLGSGQFIHAGNNGVEIANVNNSYWKSKFDSYKKFY